MKKILLSISLLIGLSSFAQVAFTENCTALTVGNIGTVTDGSVAGQHNWLTSVASTAVPAGANSDFQIVDFGTPYGNGIRIKGSTAATTTAIPSQSRILTQDISAAWTDRTSGNDIVELEYDFNTAVTTTTTNTFRTYIIDANKKAVAGYYFDPSTKTLSGWIYYDNTANGGSLGYYTIPLGIDDNNAAYDIVLTDNTWYKLGIAYNYNTGEVTWLESTGLFYIGGIEGADPGSDIAQLAFQVNSAAGNTSSVLFDIDNVIVKFNDTENLGVKQNSIVANKLSVYPNPAKDMITVSNNEIAINGIEISDINGRIVKTMKASGETNVQVNISDLSQGVYMMKIDSDQGTVTKKVIKE